MLTTTTQTTRQSALMMMPTVAAQRYGARRLRARTPHARDDERDADRPIDVIADCRARNAGNERDDGEGWAGRAMELLGVFRLVDLIRIEVLAHIMLPTGCSLPLQVAGGSVLSLRADTRLYGSCYHR